MLGFIRRISVPQSEIKESPESLTVIHVDSIDEMGAEEVEYLLSHGFGICSRRLGRKGKED